MDIGTVAVTCATGAFGAAVCNLFETDRWQVLASDSSELPQGYENADVLVIARDDSKCPDWLTCSPGDWRSFRATGLDSAFMAVQAYANARLLVGEPGSIVLVTSDSSHAEDGSDALDSAVSWGIRGLVRNASAAYARKGVRVNGICADGAGADDIASLAAFLAQGEHITGQTIPVAGGRALL